MSPLVRWARFNLVGVLGSGIQLAALQVLSHLIPGHVLAHTIAAVELALLHNFCWHVRFTWRERQIATPRSRQLVRFHLSNGVVSFAGNTFITWVLVTRAGWPPIVANLLAIVSCSAVTFLLSDAWAFSSIS